MKLFSLFFVLFLKASIIVALTSIREWSQLDFNFPSPRARTEAVQRRNFVPENNFPIDVDVDYQGEIEIKLSWLSIHLLWHVESL